MEGLRHAGVRGEVSAALVQRGIFGIVHPHIRPAPCQRGMDTDLGMVQVLHGPTPPLPSLPEYPFNG